MPSLIHLVFRFDLDCSFVIVILDKFRGIVDEYAFDRAARFLPRLPVLIKLEFYKKNFQFININANVTL